MTSSERLLTVLRGGLPDRVPCAPDTSQMIPARLVGGPVYNISLYQNPPPWKAYIDCVKHFGFDGMMDWALIEFDEEKANEPEWKTAIVKRTEDAIFTQEYHFENHRPVWSSRLTAHYRDSPPHRRLLPALANLPEIPLKWAPLELETRYPTGERLLKLMKEEMGHHGLIGAWCGTSRLLGTEQDVYDYYENPDTWIETSEQLLRKAELRFKLLMQCDPRPDFICCGASGTLIFQTPEIFRTLGLPIVKRVTQLARDAGIPSHIHSCGPEKALIDICANETDLTVIDPLEQPPMGDCDLADIKRRYGRRLVLKGNLHTTKTMLMGSASDVQKAARKAIDDAAEGGRFILSTGDQCPRDTPFDNIHAMMEAAVTHGGY